VSTVERFIRFNGVGALGIAVQLLIVYALVTWAGIPAAVATAAGVATAVVHNFFWHHHWTWSDRRGHADSILGTFFRFALANGLVSLIGNVAIVSILVVTTGLGSIPANVIAIALCGIINYWAGDTLVFV